MRCNDHKWRQMTNDLHPASCINPADGRKAHSSAFLRLSCYRRSQTRASYITASQSDVCPVGNSRNVSHLILRRYSRTCIRLLSSLWEALPSRLFPLPKARLDREELKRGRAAAMVPLTAYGEHHEPGFSPELSLLADRSLGDRFQPCQCPPRALLFACPSLHHAVTLLSRPPSANLRPFAVRLHLPRAEIGAL
jgi:hypothetical protein